MPADLPATGDEAVDEGLRRLAGTPGLPTPGSEQPATPTSEELDAVLAAGEDVHRILTGRLSDLGT